MATHDEQFVQMAKDGLPAGVAALYERYFAAIYRFCYWQTNQSDDTEDLTQDIFVEMAKSIRRFQGHSSFKNWLYVLAKRRVMLWIKERYHLPTVPIFDMIPDPAERWIDPENMDRKSEILRKLFRHLTEIEEKVMQLRFLQNFSVKETAHALKISENNVKVVCSRSLKKLQAFSKL